MGDRPRGSRGTARATLAPARLVAPDHNASRSVTASPLCHQTPATTSGRAPTLRFALPAAAVDDETTGSMSG